MPDEVAASEARANLSATARRMRRLLRFYWFFRKNSRLKKDSNNFGGTGWAGAKKQSAPQVGPLSDRPWSEYENKREAFVSAYMDDGKPILSKMYSKRVRGYEAVGYAIRAPL